MAKSIIEEDSSYVKQYYEIFNRQVVQSEGIIRSILDALSIKRGDTLVTSRFIARCIAKLRGIDRPLPIEAEKKALQFFASLDALSILREKGIPVYYYQRVSVDCNEAHFSENEKRRMENDISFITMLEDLDKYESDLQEIIGEKYTRNYVNKLAKIPQVISVDGCYKHEDYQSEYVNVINGKRVTIDQPQEYDRTVYVYGRCGAFGYAVEDSENIPSFLQKEFNNSTERIKIENHGLWGGDDSFLDHNFLTESINMKQGDAVIFYRKLPNSKLVKKMQERGVCVRDYSNRWYRERSSAVTFYDQPGHMNSAGYRLFASYIYEDLTTSNFSCGSTNCTGNELSAKALTQYLKQRRDKNFEEEIGKYLNTIKLDIPEMKMGENNGAIVMNCNPFTWGHRKLIEFASTLVDKLFVFVVEEDKSYFRYTDRFQMVKEGTNDLGNVIVLPSGKFIISAYTFPEYFMKDYVKQKDFDVSLDVETFCKYIAPTLNIKTRFAGQEPLDRVTQNYNESMAKILPMYGMKFHEIPRFTLDSEEVINATSVRRYLEEGNLKELKRYVPNTTYDILIKHYLKKVNK